MTLTLYDIGVPGVVQSLRAVSRILDRTARHCAETGTDPDPLALARLVPDMAPLHFQIEALKNHAVFGLETIRTGVFAPPPLIGAMPFSALQAIPRAALATIEALPPEAINRHAQRARTIEIFLPLDPDDAARSAWGPRSVAFTLESFLLTYTLPNVAFHAMTAYHILRTQGMPIGKGDFLGPLGAGPA